VSSPITIVDWRDVWASEFETCKAAVLRAAPAGAYVHHIGSTAVQGLAAKDVIDVQVTVTDLDAVDDQAFSNEGFVSSRRISTDHCPPGLTLTEADLTKRFFKSNGRPANIHVRVKGRYNQRFALLCRDYLRARPVAAQAYAIIKQRLAERDGNDDEAYYDIKDPVFDIIITGAEDWAQLVGWSEPQAD
jgi:GrpB-like predicted nucleotidyltransferase (UPF0157 family)